MLIAIAGLLVTVSWLVLSFWYVEETVGFEGMLLLLPNEVGQFIIGVFAPIAFLWLILGFFHVAQRLRRLEDTMWHRQPVPRLQAPPPPRASAPATPPPAAPEPRVPTAYDPAPRQAGQVQAGQAQAAEPAGIPGTAPPYPPLPPEAPDPAPARGGFAARLRGRLRERDSEGGSPQGDPRDRGLAGINPFGASRRSASEPSPAFDAVVGARESEASRESGTSRGESLRPEAPPPKRPGTAFSRAEALGPEELGPEAPGPDPLSAGRDRPPLGPPRDRRDRAVPPPNTLAAAPPKRPQPIFRSAETDRPTADRRFRPSGSFDGTEAEEETRSGRPGRRPREEAAARLASRSAAEGTRLDGGLEPVPPPAPDAARPRRPAATLSPDPFRPGSPTQPLATAATVVPEAPPAGVPQVPPAGVPQAPPAGLTAEAGAPDAGSGSTRPEPAAPAPAAAPPKEPGSVARGSEAPARPPQRKSGAPEAAATVAVPSDSAPTTQTPPASARLAARAEPANPVPNRTPRVVASVTPVASAAEPNAPRPKDAAPGPRMVPTPIPAASSIAVTSPADSKATGPVARGADKESADAEEPRPVPEAPPAKEAKRPPKAPPVTPPPITPPPVAPSPVAPPLAEAGRAGEARPIGFRHLVRITTLDLNTLAMDLSSALCKPGEHAKALKGYDRGEKDVFFDQVRGQIAGGDPENVRRRLVAGSALQHLDRYQDRFERLLDESRSIDVSGAVAKSLEAMAIGRLHGAIKKLRETGGQDVA